MSNYTRADKLAPLKHLSSKPSEPIKHIQPKQTAEAEYSPRTIAAHLIEIARQHDFNGSAKLTLAEARHELNDNSLQLKDLTELLGQYYPAVHVEPHPGNVLYLTLNVKHTIKKVIPETPELGEKKP